MGKWGEEWIPYSKVWSGDGTTNPGQRGKMHSDTARFGIKVFKDCIILFCLSVLKKKRWNQRSLNILKPRFNLWKQLQLRIHFIHVCRDHLSIPWIFKSYENTYNLPFSFWKVWIYGFKVPIFFSDKYLVLIRTRLLLQRNLLRKKNHTHEIISCIHLLDSVFL